MFFGSVPLFFTSRARSPIPDTSSLDFSSYPRKETLWWQEEIPHAPAFHSLNGHRPTYAPRISRIVNKNSETSRPVASSNELLEDNQSDDSNVESDDSKIPKPTGEAGRPGRGGYNLEQAVKLSDKDFKKIKNYVYRLIAKHLDQKHCISKQERAAIRIVERQAVLQFPELDDYDKLWPVTDLIKLRLKYTAARCKRQKQASCGS